MPTALAAPVVHSPVMTKQARGEAMRGRILAELRRRRDAWEPEPTQRELAALVGIDQPVVLYHLRILRGRGQVHPDAVLITPKGHGEET